MSNINLLPWREVSKQRQKKLFLSVLGFSALCSISAVLLVNFAFQKAIDYQSERNQYLSNEIRLLDAKIAEVNILKKRRADLIERMRLIDELQQSRNQAVHLYNDLPSLVTTGVYLDSLTFKGNAVDVVGKTEAHSRVANMMRMIDKSSWLGQTNIKSIFASADKAIPLSEFSLTFSVFNNGTEQKTNKINKQEKKQ